MSNKLNIGLFGYGCVGSGLFRILRQYDLPFAIKKIGVKNISKPRDIDAGWFTFNKEELLTDDSIQVIVELIDDADEAFYIVKQALLNGKHVVSANKKMIATNLSELIQLQQQTGKTLLYEGAVCGSIPALRILDQYYANEELSEVAGILNGTTNYILTQMADGDLDYQTALQLAADAGFAESNPVMDVESYDPSFKLQIILAHAFGIITQNEQIIRFGVKYITAADIQFAKQMGCKIKLIARVAKTKTELCVYVMPTFVDATNALFNINHENNALSIQPHFADKQFFSGKGAGSFPTASAVLSDLTAITQNQSYAYSKQNKELAPSFNSTGAIKVYVRTSLYLSALAHMQIEQQWHEGSTQFYIGNIPLNHAKQLTEIQNNGGFVAAFDAPPTIKLSTHFQKNDEVLFSIH